MKFFNFGKKENSNIENNSDKNKKINSDQIRIRINRLVGNNTPGEIAVFVADIQKDKYENSIIINEETGFREEFPNIYDSLVSDIKSKLESYGLSKTEQIKKVEENIKKKEEILSKSKNGKILVVHRDTEEEEEININVETEKANLRLLKVTKYILENKNSGGSFEKIELDGMRCLTYQISDGELLPCWHNTPNVNGEPVTLTPDMSLRKKYFYDNEQERLDDLKDMFDTPINRILKVIALIVMIVFALGELGAGAFLINKYNEVNDESLQPQLDQLKIDLAKAEHKCSSQIANQVENNDILLNWAKYELQNEVSKAESKQSSNNNDANNINI